jgi:hypothetical protein
MYEPGAGATYVSHGIGGFIGSRSAIEQQYGPPPKSLSYAFRVGAGDAVSGIPLCPRAERFRVRPGRGIAQDRLNGGRRAWSNDQNLWMALGRVT